MARKLYWRCCRCNALLQPGEPFEVTTKTYYNNAAFTGQHYKSIGHPRRHIDPSICERIVREADERAARIRKEMIDGKALAQIQGSKGFAGLDC